MLTASKSWQIAYNTPWLRIYRIIKHELNFLRTNLDRFSFEKLEQILPCSRTENNKLSITELRTSYLLWKFFVGGGALSVRASKFKKQPFSSNQMYTLTRGRYILKKYQTRTREIYQIGQQRKVVFEQLSSQSCVDFLNRFTTVVVRCSNA